MDKIKIQDVPSRDVMELVKSLKNGELHQIDTVVLMNELRRLERAELVPNCSPFRQFAKFRTVLGKYAQAYLDVLKKAKSNPEMTLQEYIEL